VLSRANRFRPFRLGLDREDLDETYEQNKQEQLRKQKEGTATWAESLASASEATVRPPLTRPAVICNSVFVRVAAR
jgi:hypothetical protein